MITITNAALIVASIFMLSFLAGIIFSVGIIAGITATIWFIKKRQKMQVAKATIDAMKEWNKEMGKNTQGG